MIKMKVKTVIMNKDDLLTVKEKTDASCFLLILMTNTVMNLRWLLW